MNEPVPPQQEIIPTPEKLPEVNPPAVGTKVNLLAILSLVTGVAPFILVWIKSTAIQCVGALCPVAAIVLGAIGLSQIKKANGAQSGKKLAIAGIILGAVLILLAIIIIVLVFVLGATILKNILPGLNSLGL